MWLAVALILATPYQEPGLSGSDLAKFCDSPNPTLGVLCNVYLAGYMDGSAGRGYCTPEKVQLGSVAGQVRTWLRERPERLSEPAMRLVADALRQTYPCGKAR